MIANHAARFVVRTLTTAVLVCGNLASHAAVIPVPNGSFESPATVYADPRIDVWQKSPKPVWYDETANGPWDQLTGVFLNPPASSTNNDHIVNCDGAQAAFLFALPEVALFQDSVTSSNAVAAVFEPDKSYDLAVAVLGNGAGMAEGVTLEIGLYYRDAATNAVVVASTTITNSAALFPARTNLVDFHAALPTVQATDPWAGKAIGIQIASTVSPLTPGGYWDVDNVRLVSTQTPRLAGTLTSDAQFRLSVSGEPGAKLEVLASPDAAAAAADWTLLATLTNTTGLVTVTNPADVWPGQFYQARQLP